MKKSQKKINKTDLLKQFLEKYNNQEIHKELFEDFFNILEKSLSEKQDIELRNFGTFKNKEMKSKFMSHPKNKTKLYIPKKNKIIFTPSKAMKEKINE